MNLDKFGNYFRDKKIIWGLLPVSFLLTILVYSNSTNKEESSENVIPMIPLAKNDSITNDKYRKSLMDTSSKTYNNLDSLNKDGLIFKKDGNNEADKSQAKAAEGTGSGSDKLLEDIETKVNNNKSRERSYSRYENSSREYYEDGNNTEDEETLAKIEKQKKAIALLEKLTKQKEEIRQRELDKKPKKYTAEGEMVSTVDYEASSPNSNSFHTIISVEKENGINKTTAAEFSAFRGMIHANQEIISGGRVQIRTLEPLVIKGFKIPKGTIIYGVANFGTERVNISLSSVFYEDKIFPIDLTAYDMDGMQGIYVPNVVEGVAVRQGVGNVIANSNTNIGSSGSSTKFGRNTMINATNVIGQSGKQLLNNKITRQKALLKANYFIYLK